MILTSNTVRCFTWTVLSLTVSVSCVTPITSICAQTQTEKTPAGKKSQTKTDQGDDAEASKAEALKAQQREFAVSMLMSLAEEARSYRDLALRPRILSRTADALWDADSNAAREHFRRAWEAAEKADAEDPTGPPDKNAPPVMVIALKKIGGNDFRSEVLTLAARRDRVLGEEFLAKLTEQAKREAEDAKSDSSAEDSNDSWTTSQVTSKRLLAARRLLDEGQIDQALEFATPVLNRVNEKTISFLSVLREKRAEVADRIFLSLLDRVELDLSSDANTVSGLSSYAFTPGFYVTFAADGSVRWSPAEDKIAAPNLPAGVRNRFFRVAAAILLRPSPPPEQDFTSAGLTGKLTVIKRLLPLFEQYAPDTAVALRSQLTAITREKSLSVITDENSLMTEGIQPGEKKGNVLAEMQDRLDHAKTSYERDGIYEDAAALLALEGDIRAQELADKIDKAELRARVRTFVYLSLIKFAIGRKDALSVVKLAKAEDLDHTQRAWAYLRAAQLLSQSDRVRSLEILQEALAEVRRIDAADANRVRMLIGVATQLFSGDRLRAWELMGEVPKAANASDEFTGEDRGLHFPLASRSGLKILELDGSELSLSEAFRLLAKEDLSRASEIAKSLQNDAPRAVATLAIASSLLAK